MAAKNDRRGNVSQTGKGKHTPRLSDSQVPFIIITPDSIGLSCTDHQEHNLDSQLPRLMANARQIQRILRQSSMEKGYIPNG